MLGEEVDLSGFVVSGQAFQEKGWSGLSLKESICPFHFEKKQMVPQCSNTVIGIMTGSEPQGQMVEVPGTPLSRPWFYLGDRLPFVGWGTKGENLFQASHPDCCAEHVFIRTALKAMGPGSRWSNNLDVRW